MFNFIKLNNEAILPNRATKNSAGYDLYSNENKVIKPGERSLIHTGVTIELSENYFLGITSKSGLAIKNGMFVLNSVGIIDSDYYPGEIGVILYNSGDDDFNISKGIKIAQGIIQEYKTVDGDNREELSERNGGFGSTGV